jgi:hypothetical protein
MAEFVAPTSSRGLRRRLAASTILLPRRRSLVIQRHFSSRHASPARRLGEYCHSHREGIYFERAGTTSSYKDLSLIVIIKESQLPWAE